NLVLIMFKNEKGISTSYTDIAVDCEKIIKVNDRHINKKDIAFYSIIKEVPEKTFKKASSIMSDLFNNGYSLSNNENITYSYDDNYFLIDNEEIVSKGEFEEILYSELGIPLNEVAI
ncbi:hypothetical protein D7X33_47975, partial [Butyricicoccus sp. 1XD8-22]